MILCKTAHKDRLGKDCGPAIGVERFHPGAGIGVTGT
jgi:hypothetical protein